MDKNAQKLLPPELLLLAQICTKSFVSWGIAPDSTGGAYSAPLDPLAGLRGGTPGEREGGRGGEKDRGEWGGREGEGVPECSNPELASLGQILYKAVRQNNAYSGQ